jgi:hypothetical protein
MSIVNEIINGLEKMLKQNHVNLSPLNRPIFHKKPNKNNSPKNDSKVRFTETSKSNRGNPTRKSPIKCCDNNEKQSSASPINKKKPDSYHENMKFKSAPKFKNSTESETPKVDTTAQDCLVNQIIDRILPQIKESIVEMITKTESYLSESSHSILGEIRSIWEFNQNISERMKSTEEA